MLLTCAFVPPLLGPQSVHLAAQVVVERQGLGGQFAQRRNRVSDRRYAAIVADDLKGHSERALRTRWNKRQADRRADEVGLLRNEWDSLEHRGHRLYRPHPGAGRRDHDQ